MGILRNYNTRLNIYDADTIKIISATSMTNLTHIHALNILIRGLKSYGIWQDAVALWGMYGTTQAQLCLNWKDLRDTDAAFRLVPHGGITFGTNKITGNGTTGYLQTFLIPSVKCSQNSMSISAALVGNIGNAGVDVGSRHPNGNVSRLCLFYPSEYSGCNDAGTSVAMNQGSNGIMYRVDREDATTSKVYNNDYLWSIHTTPSVTPSDVELYVLAQNTNGSADNFSGRTMMYCRVGAKLGKDKSYIEDRLVRTYLKDIGNLGSSLPIRAYPLDGNNCAYFIGDSVSWGSGDAIVRYSNSFSALICAAKGYTEINWGKPGEYATSVSTSGYFLKTESGMVRAPRNNDSYWFLEFGINDCRSNVSASTYQIAMDTGIADMISQGIPANKIIIISVPKITSFGSGSLSLLLDYNTALQTIATNRGCVYVDITTGMTAGMLSADGVHPNVSGCSYIATTIEAVLP